MPRLLSIDNSLIVNIALNALALSKLYLISLFPSPSIRPNLLEAITIDFKVIDKILNLSTEIQVRVSSYDLVQNFI